MIFIDYGFDCGILEIFTLYKITKIFSHDFLYNCYNIKFYIYAWFLLSYFLHMTHVITHQRWEFFCIFISNFPTPLIF